ncbi:MAG: hypothetical protein MJZ29_09505 [Bacteroidaceae bacterium]|nr:hypothetical protein [Bacteroidaceae bacterium]
MKKFLTKIMFAAVAVLSVAGFTSCNNADDDPYVPTPASVQEQTQVVSEARYLARIPEVAFKYADFTLTLEYNGEKHTYKVSENSKSGNFHFGSLEEAGLEPNLAVRVIDIPFQYNAKRIVKASLSYELTETGKQLIANAVEGEEFDFAINIMFGECDKAGNFGYNTKTDERAFGGVHANEFDGFLDVLNSYGSLINKTLY